MGSIWYAAFSVYPFTILIYNAPRTGQSKLANVLFSNYISSQASSIFDLSPAAAENVYSNSLHPGAVNTELIRGPAEDSMLVRVVGKSGLPKLLLLTPEKGAATQLWLVTNPKVVEENISYVSLLIWLSGGR